MVYWLRIVGPADGGNDCMQRCRKEGRECQVIRQLMSDTYTYPLTKLFRVYPTEIKAPRNLHAHQSGSGYIISVNNAG